MTISHALREAKLVQGIIAGIPLYVNGCTTLKSIVSLSALIKSDFTHNLCSQLSKDTLNTLTDIFPGLIRDSLYLLGGLLALRLLDSGKIVKTLGFLSLAFVDKSQRLHFDHDSSMFLKMCAEVVLKDEELLFEGGLSLVAVILLDSFLPHAHEFPFFELTEEVQLLDMVKRVTLDQPLTEGQKFDRYIIFVMGETFSTYGVEIFFRAGIEGCVLQVVRIVAILLGVQVEEHSLFFALAIKQKLYVLIEVCPFLWLRFFLIIIILTIDTTFNINLNIIITFFLGIVLGRQSAG